MEKSQTQCQGDAYILLRSQLKKRHGFGDVVKMEGLEKGMSDLMSMMKKLAESSLQKDIEAPTGPTPEKRTVSEANRLRKGKYVVGESPQANLFAEGVETSITIAVPSNLGDLGGKSHPRTRREHERTERPSAFTRLGTKSTCSSTARGKSIREKALEDEVQKVRKELRDERNRTHRARRSPTPGFQQNESPFTKEILDHELPKNFVMPNIESFDGSKDPNEHLVNFKTKMCLMNAPDAIMCRAFPTTMRGPAGVWYNNLKPGSVYSFLKLSKLFSSRFAATLKPRKSATYLFTVKQGHRETVKSYLAKFNTEFLQIDKPDEKIVVTAFMEGLQPSTLLYSFAKNPPNSMAEMLDKAQAHIVAEDHMKSRSDYQRDLEHSRERERPRHRSREKERSTHRANTRDKGGREGGRDNRNRGEYEPKYKRYAPLKASTRQIFSVIRNDPQTPWPEPIKGGKGRKYCDYHRSKGHDTSLCRELKDEIERRIRFGDLAQFRADCPDEGAYDLREQLTEGRGRSREHRSRSRSRSRERTRSPRRGPPLERNQGSERSNARGRDVINFIFGGFASGGMSSSKRKTHARK